MKNIILILTISISCNNKNLMQVNKNCFINDEKGAINLADSVWREKYGNRIDEKKPFIAKLKEDSIWIVRGSTKKGGVGGVPHIEINRKTCEIIKVTHSK